MSVNGAQQTKAKTLAAFLADARIILVAVIAVVGTIFFAGMYYREAMAEIEKYKIKIDTAEKNIVTTNSELAALKRGLNLAFPSFVTDINNSGDVIHNAEPKNSGGGASPDQGQGRCPPGTFVVGIAPYKHPDGIRQIDFQCGKLPNIEIK